WRDALIVREPGRTFGQAAPRRQVRRMGRHIEEKHAPPLPKPGPRVHNARPATERSVRTGRTGRRGTKKPLHKVLTSSETALEYAAPLMERPTGRQQREAGVNAEKGVDGSKNRAIMGGSPRRKPRRIRKQALRPLPGSLTVCAGDLCGRLAGG